MSIASIASDWLKGGQGPGSPVRPGYSRFDARNALVKHHNVRGEAVFLASRRWQHSRAVSHAARMRLDAAMAAADEAEMAEVMALRSMGIGRRNMASFHSAQRSASLGPPLKPGGAREALAKRVAAETPAAKPVSKIPQRSRTERVSSPKGDKPKSSASDAKAAWAAKMASRASLAAATITGDPVIKAPEIKKPRRSAKAQTTRD